MTQSESPSAVTGDSPASPVCERNVVYLLHGFRVAGADDVDPRLMAETVNSLRSRLLGMHWADMLGALSPAFEVEWAKSESAPMADLARTHFQQLLEAAEVARSAPPRRAAQDGNIALDPMTVWVEVPSADARASLHADLLPVVDHLLHGGQWSQRGRAGTFVGLNPIEMNPAMPLLREQKLLLPLRPAALDRLHRAGVASSSAACLGVDLQGMKLYFMASGIVLLVTSLRLLELAKHVAGHSRGNAADAREALPHAMIEEGLYALGHAANRGLRLVPVQVQAPKALAAGLSPGQAVLIDISMGTVARRATLDEVNTAQSAPGRSAPRELVKQVDPSGASTALLLRDDLAPLNLPQLLAAALQLDAATLNGPSAVGGQFEIKPVAMAEHGRNFTLCCASYAASLNEDALPELAYRLSRRYGADYSLFEDEIRAAGVRPFSNICHAMATQGAAIVVKNSEAGFVGDFFSAAVRPTYLPLAVLNYHEYLHLLHLTQECAFMPDVQDPEHDVGHLKRLRSALVVFRLYFRFSHVSDLAHHNQIHRAWRDALDLDRMLQEVTQDAREAEQVLAQVNRANEQRRREKEMARQEANGRFWKRWGIGGLFVAAAGSILHIGEAVIDYFHSQREWQLLLLKGDGRSLEALKRDPALQEAVRLHLEAHHLESWLLAAMLLGGLILAWVSHKSGSNGGAGH